MSRIEIMRRYYLAVRVIYLNKVYIFVLHLLSLASCQVQFFFFTVLLDHMYKYDTNNLFCFQLDRDIRREFLFIITLCSGFNLHFVLSQLHK